MKFLCLLAIIYSLSVVATEVLILKTNDETFILHEKDGKRVSENCLKHPCLALKSVTLKEDPQQKLAGNPAAHYCVTQKGKYIIAKRASGDEDGICFFSDKSYILGWDYYRMGKKQ